MWVPPEIKDPVLFHEPTRKSVGYFGALRLRDGKLLYAREEDKFEAQSCWAFLKQLRQKSLRANRRVVVILDNAKYHHALLHKAWREEALPCFALHFLPPYSPELNPIERVWKLTRRLCLRRGRSIVRTGYNPRARRSAAKAAWANLCSPFGRLERAQE
jgi:hypothetical protein